MLHAQMVTTRPAVTIREDPRMAVYVRHPVRHAQEIRDELSGGAGEIAEQGGFLLAEEARRWARPAAAPSRACPARVATTAMPAMEALSWVCEKPQKKIAM